MKKHLKRSLLLLALALLPLTSVHAEPEKKPDDQGWESVQSQMVQPGEGFPANRLVAAAYGFIWVMVAGFVWTVWRRTESVQRELEELRKRIEVQVETARNGSRGGAR